MNGYKAIVSWLAITLLFVPVCSEKKADVPKEEVVVTLTKENFDDFIQDNPMVLVEFYAPW